MPTLLTPRSRSIAWALLLGMLAVAGYAPLYIYPATLLSLAGLFWLLRRADSTRHAFWLGYAYGLGLFGAGTWWIYVSLHEFGNMPAPLALLSTTLFCAFLALFPASAGWLGARFERKRLVAFALLWVLSEWVRGWIFTGFPWLAVGYSQIPNSPLAGMAPVLGIYGTSLATAAFAALLAALPGSPLRKKLLLALLGLWVTGSALKHVEWSQPQGAPFSVSLLQGNIAQDIKWQPEAVSRTLNTYLALARDYPAQLVVLPETALPMLLERAPRPYLEALASTTTQPGSVLVGVAEKVDGRYYNSMISLGTATPLHYRKSHLVPFGEFIPFKPLFGWIYAHWLDIPLIDLSSGDTTQRPMPLLGQKVAVNICYEDAFGEEIIRQLPEATLLVNASNDAWYGRSFAAHQHLQMSQARALETGRMMLRATNTGATAIISPQGEVIAEAPHFTTTALTGQAQGYIGTTPYVKLGNWPAILLILLALGLLWGREKK